MSEMVSYTPTVLTGAAALEAICKTSDLCGVEDEDLRRQLQVEEWMTSQEREAQLRQSFHDKLKALGQTHSNYSANSGDNADRILRLCAMSSSLLESGNIKAITSKKCNRELEDIHRQTQEMVHTLKGETTLSNDLLPLLQIRESRVCQIAEKALGQINEIETKIIQHTLDKTFLTLGYKVTKRDSAIRATKGTTTVWLEMDDKTNIHMDVSGFSGLSCMAEISKIEKEFYDKGLVLNRRGHFHGDEEGGSIAKRVQQIFTPPPPVKISTPIAKQKSQSKKSVRRPQKRVLINGTRR